MLLVITVVTALNIHGALCAINPIPEEQFDELLRWVPSKHSHCVEHKTRCKEKFRKLIESQDLRSSQQDIAQKFLSMARQDPVHGVLPLRFYLKYWYENRNSSPLYNDADMTEVCDLITASYLSEKFPENDKWLREIQIILGKKVLLLRLWIDAKKQVNERDSHGQTALHLAVDTGKEICVDLLLQGGANMYLQNNDGQSALYCALTHVPHHPGIVNKLLRKITLNDVSRAMRTIFDTRSFDQVIKPLRDTLLVQAYRKLGEGGVDALKLYADRLDNFLIIWQHLLRHLYTGRLHGAKSLPVVVEHAIDGSTSNFEVPTVNELHRLVVTRGCSTYSAEVSAAASNIDNEIIQTQEIAIVGSGLFLGAERGGRIQITRVNNDEVQFEVLSGPVVGTGVASSLAAAYIGARPPAHPIATPESNVKRRGERNVVASCERLVPTRYNVADSRKWSNVVQHKCTISYVQALSYLQALTSSSETEGLRVPRRRFVNIMQVDDDSDGLPADRHSIPASSSLPEETQHRQGGRGEIRQRGGASASSFWDERHQRDERHQSRLSLLHARHHGPGGRGERHRSGEASASAFLDEGQQGKAARSRSPVGHQSIMGSLSVLGERHRRGEASAASSYLDARHQGEAAQSRSPVGHQSIMGSLSVSGERHRRGEASVASSYLDARHQGEAAQSRSPVGHQSIMGSLSVSGERHRSGEASAASSFLDERQQDEAVPGRTLEESWFGTTRTEPAKKDQDRKDGSH